MARPTIVTCQAPVNIAVVKYWGKRNEDLILPINDSLSVTLSMADLCSTTSIAASPDFQEDVLILNGKEETTNNRRIQNCLKAAREAAKASKVPPKVNPDWKLRICSKNNFPTAAGLASSAAGYACLVATLQALYKLDGNFSTLARKGSGSACRSMFGGFVRWMKGVKEDGTDSEAVEVAPCSHWPDIRVLICVVNDARKDTGSTSGMERSVQTSDLLKHRAEVLVPQRIKEMQKAIADRNFETFARLTMIDSNQLHAVCQDTYPPIRYMNDLSWQVVSFVHRFNEAVGATKLAYTFDAGPNAFLFCLDKDAADILGALTAVFPNDLENDYVRGLFKKVEVKITNPKVAQFVQDMKPHTRSEALKYIITTKVGEGPREINDHLCNEMGLPL